MQRLSEIKEHRHYETIKNSVEHRHNRRVAILMSVVTVVMLAMAFSTIGSSPLRAKSTVSVFMGLFVLVPYSLYCIYRAVIPFFFMDCYSFTEVILDKPHRRGKNTMCFTVTLRDRMAREFETDTRGIFGYYQDPIFEDYINQKALIAYNEKTGTVLVIKKIAES